MVAIVGCALATVLAETARGQMYIVLREEDNQLRFYSDLPSGHHNIAELPVRGRSASAQILVEAADGAQRPVRQFRLESWQDTPADNGQSTLQTGFVVQLQPTDVPDRFRLRFEIHRAHEGAVELHESVLRRGFGMYYLSFSDPVAQTATVVGRAKSLVDMMLEFPQPYRAFEETAQQCTLPGVQLVPQSRYSPTVIDAVMGEEISLPAAQMLPDWPRLVAELDHDDFQIRDEAGRQLLASGPDVVRYLQKLPPEQLSLEQRSRISYILRCLTANLPPQPQPLAVEALRDLQQAPPADWLARLVLSADPRVRAWSLDRLHRQGIVAEVSAAAGRDERRAAYEALLKQLPSP